MLNVNEIFILILTTSVLVVTMILFRQLVLVPAWKLLFSAFIFYYLSTILTVVEGFFLPDIMNFFEHLFRAIFPGMLFFWCLILKKFTPTDGDGS